MQGCSFVLMERERSKISICSQQGGQSGLRVAFSMAAICLGFEEAFLQLVWAGLGLSVVSRNQSVV